MILILSIQIWGNYKVKCFLTFTETTVTGNIFQSMLQVEVSKSASTQHIFKGKKFLKMNQDLIKNVSEVRKSCP